MTTAKRPALARAALTASMALLLAGSPSAAARRVGEVEAIMAQREIPEDELLDVGVRVLDPGLPPGDPHGLEEEGVFADVRRSESRFIAVQLARGLQATGHWGAVRVLPSRGAAVVDLLVSGRIVESTGKDLVLEVRAADSRRHRWLARKYKAVADERWYRDDGLRVAGGPFEGLYAQIANDLLAERQRLDPAELREVREVSELRFAAELAPDAFDGYLRLDRKGRYRVDRLPAADDPMLGRLERIRARDHLLVDTLNEHYATFHARMSHPYDEWRTYSYEEQVAREELQRKARLKKVLGAVAVLGGILMEPDSRAESAAGQAAVISGIAAIQSGMMSSQQAEIHVEALRELGASLEAEVSPLLVDVEGQTLRLTGSAETQFAEWRRLLREIFLTETGLVTDPDRVAGSAASEGESP